MDYKTLIRFAGIAGALALVWLSVENIGQITAGFTAQSSAVIDPASGMEMKAFERVEKALAVKTSAYTFAFKGSFETPFRMMDAAPQRRSVTEVKAKPVYKDLFLKGTLIKENALAIIEDEDGKTYICKEGDRVHDRLIAAITEDMVTIRDAGGTTVLKVKER